MKQAIHVPGAAKPQVIDQDPLSPGDGLALDGKGYRVTDVVEGGMGNPPDVFVEEVGLGYTA